MSIAVDSCNSYNNFDLLFSPLGEVLITKTSPLTFFYTSRVCFINSFFHMGHVVSATWYKGDKVCTFDVKSSSEEAGSLPPVHGRKKKYIMGRGKLNLCI